MSAATIEQEHEVETTTVACDGGGSALGHPTVYLHIGASGRAECPYCGRVYRLKPGAKISHGH